MFFFFLKKSSILEAAGGAPTGLLHMPGASQACTMALRLFSGPAPVVWLHRNAFIFLTFSYEKRKANSSVIW